MAYLEARNLHKTYHLGRNNSVYALRGVDVAIESGEMVAVMGPSGCGKSTLMHILGLLQPPDRDTDPRAQILVNDTDITSLSDKERREIEARLTDAYAGEADALLEEIESLMGGQSWPSD